MIVGLVWWHEFHLLLGEHIKEIMVLWGDHFGYKFPFVCGEGFSMKRGHRGWVVTDGPKVGLIGRRGDWFEAEREDIVTLVYKCLKGCSSNDADQGGHTSGERDGVHLLGERKRVI